MQIMEICLNWCLKVHSSQYILLSIHVIFFQNNLYSSIIIAVRESASHQPYLQACKYGFPKVIDIDKLEYIIDYLYHIYLYNISW